MVKITLVKSLIGAKPKTVATAKALGLARIGHSVVLNNTPDIAGKIRVLAHLVKVETVEENA
ncbi:MAG: 50S ribosomal protein L30 [Clostridia bacterium]|nr:50S ribosomal protein L30 [Clostridia bacterium]MBQ3928225.1 50S ribosomal protein L30 [Clostridia bacterium]